MKQQGISECTDEGRVNRDCRCKQLLDLAEAGDEAAVGDLWLEFGCDYLGVMQ